MPRNLTDLMESAVSSAPPEPHRAYDITRLAQRRQRRRTSFVAAGAALAVVAVTGAGFGLTRGGHDASPQPAAPYKMGLTVDLSSAVPASAVPGYRIEPWTIPSVQRFGAGLGPLGTYQQVDAAGRLIVEDAPEGDPAGPLRIRVFDGPGEAPRALQRPPSPGSNSGNPINWIPSFLDDGRLLWHPSAPIVDAARAGFHLTDLDGRHDVFVHGHITVGHLTTQDVTRPWVSGDRFWFTSYDNSSLKGGISNSLYTVTFSGQVTKVAEHVAVAQVGDGTVAWVTTDGEVVTESASTGPQHHVTVPLPAGCHMPSTQVFQNAGQSPLGVSRSLIALSLTCGTSKTALPQLVAFDEEGRLIVHITGMFSFNPSLGPDELVFQGLDPKAPFSGTAFRYDLVTGTLAQVAPFWKGSPLAYPQGSGDRVLWYDAKGGHVGEFTQ
jgi:hypothetical protein